MVFTAWILLRKQSLQYQDLSRQVHNETKSYNNLIAVYIINEPSQYTWIISATAESCLGEESTKSPFFLVKEMSSSSITGSPNKLLFPTMALLAGVLGGVFGIGGGMLISPLLLHVGIAPEVNKWFRFNSYHQWMLNPHWNMLKLYVIYRSKLVFYYCFAGDSSNLFVHGLLLIHNVGSSVSATGNGPYWYCPHFLLHLLRWVACRACGGSTGDTGIREGLPYHILNQYSDGS